MVEVSAAQEAKRDDTVAEEKHLQEGMPTHENMAYACFGGLSNTGITAALAVMEAVKEVGLDKLGIGCLGGIPTNIEPVYGKTKAAKKIITVDGCEKNCGKKILEQAGFKVDKSITLETDIGMKKKALNEDIGTRDLKSLMEYISEEDVEKAKDLIIKEIVKVLKAPRS